MPDWPLLPTTLTRSGTRPWLDMNNTDARVNAIQPQGGVRSVGKNELILNVKDYGAVGNNVTNDAAAIQAAIDACAVTAGAVVYFPPGLYRTLSPLTFKSNVTLRGAGRNASMIVNGVTNAFTSPATTVVYFVMEHMGVKASAGHVFAPGAGGLSASRLSDVYFQVYTAGKSVWTQQAGTYIDNLVEQFEFVSTPSQTVPVWNFSSTGGNGGRNTWRNGRATYSGEYVFYLEELDPSTFLSDNVFRDINFEIPNGGCIKILSGHGNTIEDCGIYDLQAVGVTTRDLFVVGKSSTGTNSRYNTIKRVFRRGGVLGSGLADIRLAGAGTASRQTIENCDTSSSAGYVIDCGANSPHIGGIGSGVTVLNPGPTTDRRGWGTAGWFGATPVGPQTITGTRADGAALADLLTKLAAFGLVIDTSTAGTGGGGGGGGVADPWTLAAGQPTMSRNAINSATGVVMTSGVLRLAYFTASRAETNLTTVRMLTGNVVAGATPTLVRIGVYSVAAGTGALTLIGSTPNDTTLFSVLNAPYTKSLSVPVSLVAGSQYAVGALVVTAAAAPGVVGHITAAGASSEAFLEPKLCAALAGQTDLPASIAAGTVTANLGRIYAVVA